MDTVIDALLNHWLPHYPDPVLLHTDGGRHFDNRMVHGLAKLRGWDRAAIRTAYAKWTHGVAERMNREVQNVATPLCRHLRIKVNQWHTAIKMVQAALNRKPRASRGGRSPIELTTSIVPAARVHTLITPGMVLYNTDQAASKGVESAVNDMATILETHWDLADRIRRAMSA